MTTHQAFFEKPLLHFQEQTVFCQTIINCILGLLCVMFTEYVLQFSLLLENCNSFLGTINRDCKNPVCSHLTLFFRQEKVAFSGKGQLISKCLFGVFNSPKKGTKKIDFTIKYGSSSLIVFVRFLGELKIPKIHFEIN